MGEKEKRYVAHFTATIRRTTTVLAPTRTEALARAWRGSQQPEELVGWQCISIRRSAKEERSKEERRREYNLRARYGISLDEYLQIEVRQGARCAICDTSASRLVVDHAPDGSIRGLLCSPCNTAIGSLRHDLGRLNRASEYLSRDRQPSGDADPVQRAH